jgi:uncharacterized protein
MKIQVSGLSAGIHRYRFTSHATDLGLDQEFKSAVVVDATLERAATRLYLTSRVQTEGRFICDRCVEPFSLHLESSYSMVYVTDRTESDGMDPSEMQVIPPDLAVIDLSEDVRQTVILAVPFKLLCREDCRGLCPQCGRNLNNGRCGCVDQVTDSRWDKLRLLRENRS